jgi:ABC-type transport system involved in Fe-S cluster assembly fused permease/ATPase subunit
MAAASRANLNRIDRRPDQKIFNQVVKNLGITTLLIAHRDSTVAMAGKRVAL